MVVPVAVAPETVGFVVNVGAKEGAALLVAAEEAALGAGVVVAVFNEKLGDAVEPAGLLPKLNPPPLTAGAEA